MEACGDYLLDVVHVGSTAIPGIAAKPVIDMVGLLRRHRDGFAYVSAMVALGFEFRGEAGLSGRPFSGRGTPGRTTFTCTRRITRKSGRHLRFRDYPRRHPDQASAYEALKRELAARFGGDTRAYSDAKSEFYAPIDRLAVDAGL